MKRIAAYILLVIIACAQTVNAQNWTKKDLIKAGFKFNNETSISNRKDVIYGKRVNGRLNGIVLLGNNENVQLGYMVNGEMAYPYIGANTGKYNYVAIYEYGVSYGAFKGAHPMAYIASEIFGFRTWSDEDRIDICKGDYDINRIIRSFNHFVSTGKRIPETAWLNQVSKISGINCETSNPLDAKSAIRYNNTVEYAGPYEVMLQYNAKGYSKERGLEEELPSTFGFNIFRMSFEYKPISETATGTILNINEYFKIGVENGCVVISIFNGFNSQSWNTSYRIKPGVWNQFSVLYDDGTVILNTDNGTKLAAFSISFPYLPNYSIYSGNSGHKCIGNIKNIALSYITPWSRDH